MRMRCKTMALLGSCGLALFLACGGSSYGGGSYSNTGTGSMTVHLTDGPIHGYQEININIQKVEISGDGGWITLGTPNRTYNLLALTGGLSQTLAAGATLPAGHYGQMRLVLGPDNTVKLADGTVQPLIVPSGLQTGIKLIVSFDVAAGTTKDVWIDFDAAHSIQVVSAGASGRYLLRPTVRAFDKIATGSIGGTFTDAATALPLPGAMVYAETLDASGNARIARSTVTDTSGHYTLDLLPVDGSYFVVSQPKAGTASTIAYAAKASDALALSSAAPLQSFSAAFTASAATGIINGGVTPMATADQSDAVRLLQSLAVPAGPSHTFIVDSAMAAVGASTETYSFAYVPIGAYSVQGLRTTLNADGSASTALSSAVPATVTAGATLNVAIGF